MLVVTTGTPALAWVASGGQREYKGPSGASGYQSWTYVDGTVFGQEATVGATLGYGYCLDSWFDWARTSGGERRHFDARAVRTCRSNTSYREHYIDGAGYGLLGMQKAAACYGPDNNTTGPASKCAMAPGSTGDFATTNDTFSKNNKCITGYEVSISGTHYWFDGGVPTDCYN